MDELTPPGPHASTGWSNGWLQACAWVQKGSHAPGTGLTSGRVQCHALSVTWLRESDSICGSLVSSWQP